ncbi:MAG TPA: MFS transporter [Xanthomonadaceae bacterium]|nr:MFS transporter [Xanthomonadaceae bacterium]
MADANSSRAWKLLPGSIWALGMVSLFMDVSSEMIHGLLPVFVTSTLGVSAALLGWIEGVAESTASITKLFSGALSDWVGKRKPLMLLGYGLAALTKPLFPLATTATMVFSARIVDRVGKGIRGAPRDAYVADVTAPEQRGAAYGLRQSLDTVGAFIGPLIAIAFMLLWRDDLRRVLWIGVLPAFIALAILAVWVREPERRIDSGRKPANPLSLRAWARFPARFWKLLVVVALFTLMRFSEAFLVLRVQATGLDAAYAPLALVVMSGVYMFSAWPAGALSDRLPRLGVLVVGCLVMIGADLLLALGGTPVMVFVGIGAWGLHMGLTEGVLAAFVADFAPEDLRGSAFGAMNLVRGVLLLFASVIAGALWAHGGPHDTFLAGATMAAVTTLAAVVLLRVPRRSKG